MRRTSIAAERSLERKPRYESGQTDAPDHETISTQHDNFLDFVSQ